MTGHRLHGKITQTLTVLQAVTNSSQCSTLPEDGYSVDGKDQDTIINEIADQYGTDYVALATAYGDEEYFNEDASNNCYRNTW